ncbi:predicted protein [Thalassiosira pseudonana CCMP1335]|uniref:Pentacotripeptide-repeat region of PRORP domain-containing protein n=1 Tax=Thalassiosira pseudonana TaxID=35128 RepID=B8C8J6_THAPS|nr:predicted protein [Thalassiosira pseudonana CCMP1335]EED90298.1 predicted protein [Thalassiosira pseudonana CCMP1335]|eukprot:g7571.t1 g7571   contig24:931467-933552(+)
MGQNLLLVWLTAASVLNPSSAFSHGRSNDLNLNTKPSSRVNIRWNTAAVICRNQSNDEGGADSSPVVTSSSGGFTATPVKIEISSNPNTSTKTNKRANASTKKSPDKVNSATIGFNNKLNEMSKSFDAVTAPKVEALLLDAVEKYEQYLEQQIVQQEQCGNGDERKTATQKNNIIIPNTISFTNAITAWARCTRKDSPYRAHALLDQMHTLYKEKQWRHVKPNKISYNSVITAWARSRERGTSAKKAEELLRRMYEFYNEEEDGEDLKPDARSFNAVINAVARSRDKDCADRAKFLLDEMGRLYEEGDTDLVPDALTFGAIINAYANSMEEGSSDKAAQLLMHMESLYQLGFDKAKPTTFVYNACINCFAKDPIISNSGRMGKGGAMNGAEKAELLLGSMERRYEEERDHRVKPDCISYSTVINAHANSVTPQSGINADVILRRMISQYLLGDTKCKPNAISFTAAIKAHSAAINATLSSSLESDESGENITTQSSHVKQQIEASASRCEDLLQQLCLLYRSPGNDRTLKPTSVTFELVLGALAQAGDKDGVERVRQLRYEELPNDLSGR